MPPAISPVPSVISPDPAIRAYLFDLDGTLAETESHWAPALSDLLRDDGHELSEAEARTIVIGRSWNSIYADVVARFPDEDKGSDVLADRLRPYFQRRRDTADIRIPGSSEMVRAVAAHTPCAIVSGSCRQDIADALSLLGLSGCFQTVLGAEDVPRGKPDPLGYLMAAQRLGVDPGACVVVEDSAAGVRAGRAAGMRVVALVRPGALAQEVRPWADLCVGSLAEYTPAALPAALPAPPPGTPGALVDLDGTVLDSMDVWGALDRKFLAENGIPITESVIARLASFVHIREAAEYVSGELGVAMTPDAVCEWFRDRLAHLYRDSLPLLPGAREGLVRLREAGTRIALVTATDEELARAALRRLGVEDLFDRFLCGVAKREPDSLLGALATLGTEAAHTTVYDDVASIRDLARQVGMAAEASLDAVTEGGQP